MKVFLASVLVMNTVESSHLSGKMTDQFIVKKRHFSNDGIVQTWVIDTGDILSTNEYHKSDGKHKKGFVLTPMSEHLVLFDQTKITQWENNFIYNKLIECGDEAISSIAVGLPFLPHEESENRIAVLIGTQKGTKSALMNNIIN